MKQSINPLKVYLSINEDSNENENMTPPNVFVFRKVVTVTLQSDPVFADTYEEGKKIILDPNYENWECVDMGEIQQIMYNKLEMTRIL